MKWNDSAAGRTDERLAALVPSKCRVAPARVAGTVTVWNERSEWRDLSRLEPARKSLPLWVTWTS